MTVNGEIKDAIKSRNLLIGRNKVFRKVKTGKVSSLIYATNCPEGIKKDLSYYSKNFGIEIKRFPGNSRQLGELCGKPFNIVVIGVGKKSD